MDNFKNQEIRALVLENKIPVIISLAMDEINEVDTPPNLLVSNTI